MGIMEIKTTETLNDPNNIINVLMKDANGILFVRAIDVHDFTFNHSTLYNNILRKWNKLCMSYDFDKNEAQVGFNGKVADLRADPDTYPNYKGTYDANIITGASAGTEIVIIFGRYGFDRNPFIGTMANINVWDRTMDTAGKLDLRLFLDDIFFLRQSSKEEQNVMKWFLTRETLLMRVQYGI